MDYQIKKLETELRKGNKMRKTKIVCTIGPASESEETLRKMMKAGMNVTRINFSHGIYGRSN